MRPRDLATLFLLAALWGGSFPFIRVAAPAFGPVVMAAARVALAALVLWLGMRALGQRPGIRAHARALLVLGALNAAVPFALVAAAELRLTASLAAMLNATVPLWGVWFGARWLGERMTARRAGGVLLGVAGVGVLVGWSPVALTGEVLLSVAAMLVATCCYALGGVWTRRRLAGVPAPTLALGQQLGATACLALPALWQLPEARPTLPATLALLALAVTSTAFAYVLFFRLIASVGPTRTTTVTYLIPLFGTAWGALFLGEPVTPGMAAGLACILGSVLLVNDVRVGALVPRRWRRATPPAPAPATAPGACAAR
ncbi:DMT family transporter [Roseisolibacter sp. H3M3-2]|uniref:DMT family transporter n=1 Tax=Roseisolibacter sp. H3M3-2 TaxID=3031323 RepID=UPI0023DC86B1|nr:DMT family transporter [Roseisolibacter sp. H3M3-2]MDF1506275.1 DMT family transporter [Roseisolibacter sp. H3M3-2]